MGRQSFGLMSGVLAIAVCAATAAFAADLPAPAPGPSYYPPSAPPPAHYNWSGIYFGGHVGAGLEKDVVTFPTTTALPNGVGPMIAGTTNTVNPSSVIGGAQVGANLQFGPAVIGVEGTWTSSDITGNSNAALFGAGQEQSRSAPHWFATAVGKLGFAVNDWLFYAKGGGAWMRVDYTQMTLLAGGTAGLGAGPQTITDNRNGWTAGAGVEYALNENLSAKLEYDFLDFGTKNYTFNGIGPPASPAGLPASIRAQTHMILFGMNYRFYFGGFGQY